MNMNTEQITLGKGFRQVTLKAGEAELYGDLIINRYDLGAQQKPVLRIWMGKQGKPFYHHTFPGATIERQRELREAEVTRQKASADARIEWKAKRKAERTQAPNNWNVGDLISCSWGYEQTNVDFYQVVRKTEKSVWIRRIRSRTIEGSGGFMSANVAPVKDAFVEKAEVIRKAIISADYLSMEHGVGRKTTENSTHYSSWYH